MDGRAGRLRIYRFNSGSFLPDLRASDQIQYVRRYLAHLDVETIVEEPSYFDRDYLAEFSTFYSASARGYSNRCRRIHAFAAEVNEVRRVLAGGLRGQAADVEKLQSYYRGFLVVRPLGPSPIGRTVLALYPDAKPLAPRIATSARRYEVHLAGLPLSVSGLAWQQQDSAVGACATVALWTAFHSSALDEFHAIPTTVEVTRAAHRKWFMGKPEFPAHDGLHVYQMCEAIRAQGLAPAVLDGERTVIGEGAPISAFERTRFASSAAALLRSGYPVLIAARAIDADAFWKGELSGTGHAVCAVGFRSAGAAAVSMGGAVVDDGNLQHLYIHDDNIGPNVRYEISTIDRPEPSGAKTPIVVLTPDAPQPARAPVPVPLRYVLVPTTLVAALPEEIRISPDHLHRRATRFAAVVSALIAVLAKNAGAALPGAAAAARFIRLKDYLGSELGSRLAGTRLVRARLALCERAPPMSLHIGLTRIAIGNVPILDVLYDTTDSARGMEPFAHVIYSRRVVPTLKLIPHLPELQGLVPSDLGTAVRAY